MSEAAVYRMYDGDGVLLYVGQSTNVPQRLASHRSDKQWWPEVARIDVHHFAVRKAAADAEAAAIASEAPRHNTRPGTSVRFDTLAEREEHARQRAEAARLERTWETGGSIVCLTCGRQPERFPKRQSIDDTPCANCGCKTYARRDPVASPDLFQLLGKAA